MRSLTTFARATVGRMKINATMIVGFETSPDLNNKARRLLTGTQLAGQPETPFRKVATRTYVATNADPSSVMDAVQQVVGIVKANAALLNELALTIALTEPRAQDDDNGA